MTLGWSNKAFAKQMFPDPLPSMKLKAGLKKLTAAWGWWLTPVILDTQEAEFRRVPVRSQTGQIVLETLS
jgi:hypothetical protein